MLVHRLDMEMVVLKLLLIPANLRWAHLCDECVILNLIFQILGCRDKVVCSFLLVFVLKHWLRFFDL